MKAPFFSAPQPDSVCLPSQHATAGPLHPEPEGGAAAGNIDRTEDRLQLRRIDQAKLQEGLGLLPQKQVSLLWNFFFILVNKEKDK